MAPQVQLRANHPVPGWPCFPGKRNLLTALIVAVVGWDADPSRAADARVEASLHVPPAETYVLGDDIPLVWRFTNRGDDSLAMLWEGCCRLNGRLDVRAADESLEVLPPGAATFHTYSKAELLPPGRPVEFRSRLADWISLPRGGEFALGGRYTGVLPNQTPQVPDGVMLWRGTATAELTRVRLLNVADYLAQRSDREQRRQLALRLSAPAVVPPREPVTVAVTIRNLADQPVEFSWPGALQLWLVNESGLRLEKAPKFLRVPGELLELPAGGSAERTFALNATELDDSPFGPLRLFLDLAPGASGEPRLPSEAVNLDWHLGEPELVALLDAAAAGPSTGLRNPPLKLLRIHLPAVHELVAAIPDGRLADTRARELRRQLALAGCVQSIQPQPGQVFLPVNVPAGGPPALNETLRCNQLPDGPLVQQIGAIAAVRRHLGWDVTVEARPVQAATLGQLFDLDASLAGVRGELVEPLTVRVPQSTGAATNLVQFLIEPSPANVLVRVTEEGGEVRLRVAGRDPVPGRPPWLNMFDSTSLRETTGESLAIGEFADWLDRRPGTIQPLVFVTGEVRWGSLLTALQPLVDRTARLPILSED